VTTTRGAEGIDAAMCGPALRIADGWDAFARATAAAAHDERVAPSDAFVATHDWDAIVGRMRLL
jgi:hypothetical protein